MDDKISLGVKIHDIHHGLIQSSGAIVETEFDFLKGLGAAIQIATTIKDHETISDLRPLYAAAGELRIQRSLAKEALTYLEILGFVRLRWTADRREITRVDVTVPNHQLLYKAFGDYFLSENKSVLSLKTLEILEKLSAFPHKEAQLRSELGIETADYDQIKDVCQSASLIGTYNSPTDSQSVIYSPLYWDDNPKKIFDLLEKHKSIDFLKKISLIKDYQGLPDSKFSEDTMLQDAIELGCLPTLSVNSTGGLRKFIFTPRLGVGQTEKNLLHKARVLISCVRYGENFAGITKIFNPEALINALSKRGFLKGHSESLMQYEPARDLGLVKIIPSYNRFEVHFIDNEENKKVVDMAIELLQIGQTSKFDDAEEVAKKLLIPGSIMHPTQTRTKVLQDKPVERSKATLEKINDLIRGVDL